MAITTYSELKTAIADWLNRADLTEKIPDFISLAESTLNNVLRSPKMIATANVTYSANDPSFNLPSDALELVFVNTSSPMEQVSVQQLILLRRNRFHLSGTPKFFSVLGTEALMAPIPSTGATIEVMYYGKIPALTDSNTTNWLLTNNPDIYLYTALMHAAPYLNDDARLAVFNNLISQSIAAAVTKNQVIQFDGRTPGFSLNSPADVSAAITAKG